jgi:hypothetical protein
MNTPVLTYTEPKVIPLCSAHCFKKYGVYRSTLLHTLSTIFYIPAELHPALEKYTLLYQSVDYFLCNSHEGTLHRFDSEYNIVYHNCTRGQILALPADQQLRLSYRQAVPEYSLPAFVLVSIVTRKDNGM